MEILIGTNNKNKLDQFKRIFKRLNADVVLFSLRDLDIGDEVEEDQDNLLENAKKKAKYYGEKSNSLTLADDTGLFIDKLGGQPGVHAKRWHAGTENDRNIKILEMMAAVPKGQRTCRYTGVLALYNPENKEFWTYENNLEGTIADEASGAGGFGYDPIFISTQFNKYYSQLSDEERDSISHRGLGIKELLNYLVKIR